MYVSLDARKMLYRTNGTLTDSLSGSLPDSFPRGDLTVLFFLSATSCWLQTKSTETTSTLISDSFLYLSRQPSFTARYPSSPLILFVIATFRY
ncbi:hypothetical protein PM082_000349 [Marasmius tenuissimus]|nr:hypothetical protein PM082_000349 [Marasmius tenuissimus]